VTYATLEKIRALGLPADDVAREGVASEATAAAMAEGACRRLGTTWALSSTGSAGPEPLAEEGREPVPPGTVFVAVARAGHPTRVRTLSLPGPRERIQRLATVRALDLLRRALDEAG
jgi:PncC family amidohydrolase